MISRKDPYSSPDMIPYCCHGFRVLIYRVYKQTMESLVGGLQDFGPINILSKSDLNGILKEYPEPYMGSC